MAIKILIKTDILEYFNIFYAKYKKKNKIK